MAKFFYDKYFPTLNAQKRIFRHKTVIGIGGNVGNVRARFKRLYWFLNKDKRVHITQTSAILQNPPFGFVEQSDFFNAVIVLQTSMSPRKLLQYLLHVEYLFKRKRSFKNAPRTLDLDIIFFDDIQYRHKRLNIPHINWFKRESVVLPLANLRKGQKR